MQLNVFYKNSEIIKEKEVKLFNEHNLDQLLIDNIERLQFTQMTPIQRTVVPFIIRKNDVMGCSQTGSGKTIAFLAPILSKMLKEGPPVNEGYNFGNRGGSAPVALILIPTRELAEQIYKEARKLVHKTGIAVTKVYGGVGYDSQLAEVREGTDILVATPGRLIDFLKKGVIILGSVKYLVIDEADRILDMGFEDQLRSIMHDFGKNLYINQ
jgi:ATP-dependent RNA helicase DDX3X